MSRVIGACCCCVVVRSATAMRITSTTVTVTVIFTMMLTIVRSLVSQFNVIARAAYQHDHEIDEQHAANDQENNHPETPLNQVHSNRLINLKKR